MGEQDAGVGVELAGLRRARTTSAAEVAWVAALPSALIAIGAILLLGPPLGHALFGRTSDQLWPPTWWEATGHPEPVKEGRYLLAAAAPLLFAAAVPAIARREVRLPSWLVRAATATSHAALLALVGVALLNQRAYILATQSSPPVFGLVVAIVAACLVAAVVVSLRWRSIAARAVALGRETSRRRALCLAIAAGFAAIWLLKVVMTDRLAGDGYGFNYPYTLNDAVAVLDGRTPLVDYHVIYAKLLPYAVAPVLGAFGTTIFVYTVTMAVLTGLALLAVYAVFRLVTRSSLFALALFLPFVATSDIACVRLRAGTVSPMAMTAMWPARYGGVYLLAWLTARHVDALRPRRAWILFFLAGLVAVNSAEFGVAAVAATAVALLCARPPRSAGAALRLGAHAAAGVLGAVALVCLITIVRAGTPPKLALMLEWPRIFSTLGWFSLPLRLWGFHLAIYVTFAAAVVVAVVRMAQRDDRPLLTGMLAWSGVFGLLAGSYFIERPDALKLQAMLSAWSFALALLTVACVHALAARGWRRPALSHLLVLFGFGLTVCSLSRLSPPQQQIARLTRSLPTAVYVRTAERVIGAGTRRGEAVAILVPMSYRISHELGLRNLAPYGYMNAIVTRSQMLTLIGVLRREHIRTLFAPAPGSFLIGEADTAPEQLRVLAAIGFRQVSVTSGIVRLQRG
jgi:hypothetical protein